MFSEGGKFPAFKGQLETDAPLADLVVGLLDANERVKWDDVVMENYDLDNAMPFYKVLYTKIFVKNPLCTQIKVHKLRNSEVSSVCMKHVERSDYYLLNGV